LIDNQTKEINYSQVSSGLSIALWGLIMAKARACLKVEEIPAILIELGKEGSHPILESKSKNLLRLAVMIGIA